MSEALRKFHNKFYTLKKKGNAFILCDLSTLTSLFKLSFYSFNLVMHILWYVMGIYRFKS